MYNENLLSLVEDRKETTKVVGAFLNKKPIKAARSHTDGKSLYLHGNKIAWHGDNGQIHATLAGWPTTTTKDRLNGLTREIHGKSMFYTKKGRHYFGDKEIGSNDTVTIKEDIEQLDEISTKTLKSYTIKAKQKYKGLVKDSDNALKRRLKTKSSDTNKIEKENRIKDILNRKLKNKEKYIPFAKRKINEDSTDLAQFSRHYSNAKKHLEKLEAHLDNIHDLHTKPSRGNKNPDWNTYSDHSWQMKDLSRRLEDMAEGLEKQHAQRKSYMKPPKAIKSSGKY